MIEFNGEDYPLYAAALAVMVKRLQFHSGPAQFLEGVGFKQELVSSETVGADKLPALRMLSFGATESHGPGAPSASQGGPARNNTPQQCEQVWSFMLYTAVPGPMVQEDPENDKLKKRGVVDYVARILDAIETDTDGEVDAQLEQTAMRPITFNVAPGEGSGGVYETVISVNVWTRNFCRGNRRIRRAQQEN